MRKSLKPIFCILYLQLIVYSGVGAVERTPGMGGVFIDGNSRSVPNPPKKVVPGSITVVRVGRCYSLSTIDSTSHDDQSMMAGETRYLPYIIQNQGNIRDSILFSAQAVFSRPGPVFSFTGTDSQTVSTADESGPLQYGVWLEPGEVGTLLVKVEVPYATIYAASDSFGFKIDIKNQSGTGGGPDSTDNWPKGRMVIRSGALYTYKGRLTDRTSLTRSQDWMVDQFQIRVTGALNPLARVIASPTHIQASLYSAQRKQFNITIRYPGNFRDPLSYSVKQEPGQGLDFRLKDPQGKELVANTAYHLGNLIITAAADSGVNQSASVSGILVCSHQVWGERELARIDLTIEPAELAAVDRTKPQVLAAGPNPFDEQYQVRYYLPKSREVYIAIYNMASDQVKVLGQGARSGGIHTVIWDGTDKNGQRVRNGIWFCEVRMGEVRQITRIMLFR